MAAPAEIPLADEALKTLVQRFKAAPGSSAFTELAAALLARGHAAEALRITEHGLQLVPGSVEGRVQRAAALLAQGRPRMAYVELRRALAIEPHHRRAQRLLGKAYVDAGAPERAAALLAQRSTASDTAQPTAAPTSNLAAALIGDLTDDGPPTEAAWPQKPQTTASESSDLPDLFSALTEDLGLGRAAAAARPQRRVEVTQIIRRKARPRPPRTASELAEIDGPIVDTTQPRPARDEEDEPAPVVTTREPAPVFPANPDLASLALDDEPLFHEHMPFAVHPVRSPTEEVAPASPEAPEPARGPAPSVAPASPPAPEPPARGSAPAGAPARSPRSPDRLDRPARPAGPDPREDTRAPTVPSGPPAPRFESRTGVLERARTVPTARLEVEAPPINVRRMLLAVLVCLMMIAYFLGWMILFGDTLRVWWTD